MPKYMWEKISASGVSPKWGESRRRRISMPSAFLLERERKRRRKVSENNSQLRIHRSRLDQCFRLCHWCILKPMDSIVEVLKLPIKMTHRI